MLRRQHETPSSENSSTLYRFYLSVILTLFMLSTLFNKDCTRIS